MKTVGEPRAQLATALGNEEESMLMVGEAITRSGTETAILRDPITFVENIREYLPENLKSSGGWRHFLQNGGLIYDGGYESDDDGNLERATPECASPYDVATYVQADETTVISSLEKYVEDVSADYGTFARWHRRVIDPYGNSKASHDNFGYPISFQDAVDMGAFQRILVGEIASRSLLTGAGLVYGGGFFAAQKTNTVQKFDTYGYVSSVMRLDAKDETGPRLEIRCSDINISPWAIQLRLGKVSMLMAAMQTELSSELLAIAPSLLSNHDAVGAVRESGRINIDEDSLQITLSPQSHRELDIQEAYATLYADKLGNYIDLSPEMREIALETIQYCHDMRSVARGDKDISRLADRSDVAAKSSLILRSIQRDRADGVVRQIGDIKSHMHDMQYDMIKVTPTRITGLSKPVVDYGAGYRLRDKGNFRLTPSNKDVAKARFRPPEDTRAYTRGEMIRRGIVDVRSWSKVAIPSGIDRKKQLEVLLDEVDGYTKDDNVVDVIEYRVDKLMARSQKHDQES